MRHLQTFESFNFLFEGADMGGLTKVELEEMGMTKAKYDEAVDKLLSNPEFKKEAEKLIKSGDAKDFVKKAQTVAQSQAQAQPKTERRSYKIYESKKAKSELADNLVAGGIIGMGASGILAGAATLALSGLAATTIAVPFMVGLGASILATAVGKMMGGKL